MTLFGAEGEPVNWGGIIALAIIMLFVLSNFAVAVSVWLQQYRKHLLVIRMENATVRMENATLGLEAVVTQLTTDAASATVDRQQVRRLLEIVSGWAVVVESNERNKVEHLKQVALTAKENAEEVKASLAALPDKVVERLDQSKADSGINPRLKPPEGS